MAYHHRLERLRKQAQELPDIGGIHARWSDDDQLDDILSRMNFHCSYGTVQSVTDREIHLLAMWLSYAAEEREPAGEMLLEHSNAVVRWRKTGGIIYLSLHHDGSAATIEKLLDDLPVDYRMHIKRMPTIHQREHELLLFNHWLERKATGEL